MFTWGSNEKGQLGHDRDTELMPRVVRSLMHSPVVQIAAVGKHTFALTGFEHNGTNQQLEAWVASVQEQDEKRRKEADRAFFAFLEACPRDPPLTSQLTPGAVPEGNPLPR